MIALSVIVVTKGRETLRRTLESIHRQVTEADEVLVVGKGESISAIAREFGCRFLEDGPFGNWGQVERQNAMKQARGTHLLFMDDDDYYLCLLYTSDAADERSS